MSASWRACTGLASAVALGCYRSIPITFDQAPVGAEVRVVVVADRASIATARDGVRSLLTLQGTLLGRDSSGILLSVPVTGSTRALAYQVGNQRVRVAPGDVVRIERRELDGKRTAGLVGVLVGAAVAATVTGGVVGEGFNPQPMPGQDESLRAILHLACCR